MPSTTSPPGTICTWWKTPPNRSARSIATDPAGSWGHVGCFSFYPTKNLGGMGDGGMLTTNDAELADRLGLYAAHGMQPRYYHQVVGINSRLDTMQAAVLNVKMRRVDQWNAAEGKRGALPSSCFERAGLDQTTGAARQ